MTNEEAVNILNGIRADNLNLNDLYTKDKFDALGMAISALSVPEREKGTLEDIRSEILGYNVRGRVSGSESFLMGYASGMDKAAEIVEKYKCIPERENTLNEYRQKVLNAIAENCSCISPIHWDNLMKAVNDINILSIPEREKGEWIPIKTRALTEEEKKEYEESEIGEFISYMYDCPLPNDGEEVLVTNCVGSVVLDTFCRDYEGCYFECNCDEGDVLAWQPLPKPYKAESEDKE